MPTQATLPVSIVHSTKIPRPWQGLGVAIPRGTQIPEMLKLAGLDWRVKKLPLHVDLHGPDAALQDDHLYAQPADAVPVERQPRFVRDADHFALVRDSDEFLLTAVGRRYRPIQNRQAFAFFDEFVGTGEMRLDVAGSLKNGRIVWASASMDENFRVGAGDRLSGHIQLTQAHDYGQSMKVRLVAVREVSGTTIIQPIREKRGASQYLMPHSRRFDEKRIEEIKQTLGIARRHLNVMKGQITHMAGVKWTEKQAVDFLVGTLMPDLAADPTYKAPKKLDDLHESEEATRMVRKVIAKIDTQPGADLPSSKGTLWGLFNAVAHTVDFNSGRNRDTGLTSAWFGQGANIKKRAYNLAVAMSEKSHV